MRKQALLFCVFAVSAGFLMWTCSKDSGPTGPGDGGSVTTETRVYSYTVLGSTIIVSIPEDIYSYSYCNGNTLETYSDTSPAHDEPMPFVVSGDTLKFIEGTDTVVLIRMGSGSGLIGQWYVADTDLQNGQVRLDITTSTLTVTITVNNCYVDDFIDSWNCCGTWADSASYDITVLKLSCTQVRLTGNISGEVVTISWDTDGNMTFTSNNTGHAAHTWYENPTSCPNFYPDWYYTDFLYMNPKNTPAAKRAERPFVPRVKKHSIFR